MEPQLGVLLGLMLVVSSSAQSCTCETNKWTVCTQDASGNCSCKLVGSDHTVNCSTLTSKCLLMKTERTSVEEKFFLEHHGGLPDDGIYNPDCEDSGVFKARQCDQAGTCWCVNTAGVRRTEKGDRNLSCDELIRTSWVDIELKHKETSYGFEACDVADALTHLLENRYKLQPKYIAAVKYDSPFIQIHLKQSDFEQCDVDIADVAYYLEKDIRDDSIFHSDSPLHVYVNGDALDIENIRVYYVDEKPPVFCMTHLTSGVTAVVTAVTLPVAVTGLVILMWQRSRKYRKNEIQKMDE
ncbi:TACD2 protein, partial [Penelope pileata]|nr:TACD2 protein [Penelope pileata]